MTRIILTNIINKNVSVVERNGNRANCITRCHFYIKDDLVVLFVLDRINRHERGYCTLCMCYRLDLLGGGDGGSVI